MCHAVSHTVRTAPTSSQLLALAELMAHEPPAGERHRGDDGGSGHAPRPAPRGRGQEQPRCRRQEGQRGVAGQQGERRGHHDRRNREPEAARCHCPPRAVGEQQQTEQARQHRVLRLHATRGDHGERSRMHADDRTAHTAATGRAQPPQRGQASSQAEQDGVGHRDAADRHAEPALHRRQPQRIQRRPCRHRQAMAIDVAFAAQQRRRRAPVGERIGAERQARALREPSPAWWWRRH